MPECTKEVEKSEYLEKLNRKVTKEIKELLSPFLYLGINN